VPDRLLSQEHVGPNAKFLKFLSRKTPTPLVFMVGSSRGVIPRSWEGIVLLIVYYVIFVLVGDLADYLIGLVVEREFGSNVSLLVFLALYFLVLWVAWVLAVRMTAPKHAVPATGL
jgi:hypothetical protein